MRHFGGSWIAPGAIAALTIGILAAAPSVQAGDDAVQDIVEILKERGLIDEATEQQILVKNAAERRYVSGTAPEVSDGFEFLKSFEWEGDLRIRNEQFWYSSNSFPGSSPDDRNRYRYRLRFGFKKKVNDWFTVGMRLASGADNNSTNLTLGDSGDFDDENFGNDQLSIDRAFVELKLPTGENVKSKLVAGKFGNPFTWKNGKDYLIWDGDLTPEGLNFQVRFNAGENAELFTNGGFFILDEDSDSADEKMYGFQAGGIFDVGAVQVGARGSYYRFNNLQSGFISDALDRGSLPGAFDDPLDRNTSFTMGEVTTFVKARPTDLLPVLLYGTYVKNFDADSTSAAEAAAFGLTGTAGDEDTAFGIGFEIGDKKKLVTLGFAYFDVEANAVIPQFTDSDLFDGDTNRQGFTFYLTRQLLDRVELNLTYFDGEEKEDDLIFATGSSNSSDRRRLQSDIKFKF